MNPLDELLRTTRVYDDPYGKRHIIPNSADGSPKPPHRVDVECECGPERDEQSGLWVHRPLP